MKSLLLASITLLPLISLAQDTGEKKAILRAVETEEALSQHREGAEELADDQDEQSADVQELIDEQTNPNVIELLSDVEILMAEAIDQLEIHDTSGETIAIQTEIIEKIYEAAKAKNQKSGEGKQGNSAMLKMMEQMMGKGEKPGPPKKKQGQGQSSGDGMEADSNAANTDNGGKSDENKQERRFEKIAGESSPGLPPEFQKSLDAYNRSIEKNRAQ